MGFKTGDMPPVDPAAFETIPFRERIRILQTFWAEYGTGGPKIIHTIYIAKLVFFVVAGALITGLTTPGLSLLHLGAWWGEPIVYEKAMLWTILFEITGYASASGPLAFHFKPFTGGWHYWARRKTLRLPPWSRLVPFTKGDERTAFDTVLYVAIIAVLVANIVMPGQRTEAFPSLQAGLVSRWGLLAFLVLICVMGLRDRVVFLAARSEQYIPVLFFLTILTHGPDMIFAAKLAMVVSWVGAAVSKFGRHFAFVIPPMLSNTPWIGSKKFKRSLYRDFPNDLRPSVITWGFAHIGGTFVELVLPLILLFSPNRLVTVAAIGGIVLFHIFIISTFPLAVPLEWNVFFGFNAIWHFGGFGAWNGYGIGDVSSPWVLAAFAVVFFSMPVLGNLRPDLVSFLPSMRQYAGNWAASMWAFRGPEAEEKLNRNLVKYNETQINQLSALYGTEVGEVTMATPIAWRVMHTQGKGMLSLMMRHTDRLENYRIREGEFVCSVLIGWAFGDGHMHDHRTIASMQKRVQFEPGECLVTWVESQPIHKKTLQYQVIDAALGVVERGWYHVDATTNEQPWLPNGPIEHTVTWTAPGYKPAGEAHPAPEPSAVTA
ncbi:DUF3556 domain-containing protein [Streptomyces sp. NPDC002088]|uniref:DUF3556 domain-containing protein n=1 Tax=Streptomyces sp. NPDC002088 TaxID=3154665 RepID=UPI00332B6024